MIQSMSEGRFRPLPTSTRVPTRGPDHLVTEERWSRCRRPAGVPTAGSSDGPGPRAAGPPAGPAGGPPGGPPARLEARPKARLEAHQQARPDGSTRHGHPPVDRIVGPRARNPAAEGPEVRAGRGAPSDAAAIDRRSKGSATCQDSPASRGSATGAFTTDQVPVATGPGPNGGRRTRCGAISALRTTMAGASSLCTI